MAAPSTYRWFTSSYSGGSGTECVTCAHAGERMLVRDSKRGCEPVIAVEGQAWQAFTHALKQRGLEQ
ncbi:DUF397 domain-containing protein [Streptomyces sp. NPDC048665]|uniref:DUF397 domain-containing protein n=1 Tax=unclassified Streptomyces TaxID=2593676 RepID=UPI001D8F1669|nr:DUF397 domain-containing protein [Streptomyces sp. tea 10]